MRPRFFLPLLLVPLTVVLLLLGYQELQSQAGQRLYANFGAPATRLAYALNAPAFLAKWWLSELLHKVHPFHGPAENIRNNAVFLIAASILWYSVGLDIERRRRDHINAVLSRLRIGLCVALVLIGIFLVLMAIGSWNATSWRYVPLWQALPEAMLYMLWGLVLVGVFGRDLVRYLAHRATASRAIL